MDNPLGSISNEKPRTFENAQDIRVRAWMYVFECHNRRANKGGRLPDKSGLDDAKGSDNASRHD